jgi:starch phosphorylase
MGRDSHIRTINRGSSSSLHLETRDGQHHFQVEVRLGRIDPDAVRLELYADGSGEQVCRQPLARGDQLPGREGFYLFTGQTPATRPGRDFTPRLIPYFPGVAVPLEIPLILWHH